MELGVERKKERMSKWVSERANECQCRRERNSSDEVSQTVLLGPRGFLTLS